MKIKINSKFVELDDKLKIEKHGSRNYYYYDNIRFHGLNGKIEIKFKCESCKNNFNYKIKLQDIQDYECICQSCQTKKTKLKKYGATGYNNQIKAKQTNLKKYGAENPMQNHDIVEKVKQTSLERYGVDNPAKSKEIKEKAKQTSLDRYNTVSPSQNEIIKNKIKKTHIDKYGGVGFQSNEMKEKAIQTNLKKYGTENPMQNDSVIEKTKLTNLKKYGNNSSLHGVNQKKIEDMFLEKYGVNTPFKSKEVKEKIKKTNIKKYGVEYTMCNVDIAKKVSDSLKLKMFNTMINGSRLNDLVRPLFTLDDYNGISGDYEWKCNKCDTIFTSNLINGNIPRCPECFPCYKSISEQEIVNYIKSLAKNVDENNRKIIAPYELDIYIPDYNLAIEFNGLYWHSELQGKDRNYHLNKTLECQKRNVQLIHIFEDEWLNKQDIIKSIIAAKLGVTNRIYGRKCIIKEINNQKEFLNKNHMQGYISAKVNIGLYYENELVSLLTFGKSRFNKKYDWEILRYANKLNTSIIGGFTKLLKYFLKNYKGNIITYSDRRLFNGSIYENNGFNKLSFSPPSYYYFKGLNRYNRQQFQKHKLKNKLKIFDPNLTEWENMQMNGWDRIWDCGNNVFELKGNND